MVIMGHAHGWMQGGPWPFLAGAAGRLLSIWVWGGQGSRGRSCGPPTPSPAPRRHQANVCSIYLWRIRQVPGAGSCWRREARGQERCCWRPVSEDWSRSDVDLGRPSFWRLEQVVSRLAPWKHCLLGSLVALGVSGELVQAAGVQSCEGVSRFSGLGRPTGPLG